MIELVVKRSERYFDVGEIDDPARRRIDLSADVNLDSEAMTMQSMAFVIGRHEWKPVCRLESELLEDLREGICGRRLRQLRTQRRARPSSECRSYASRFLPRDYVELRQHADIGEFRVGSDLLAQPPIALANGFPIGFACWHRRPCREHERDIVEGTADPLCPSEVVIIEAHDLQNHAPDAEVAEPRP